MTLVRAMDEIIERIPLTPPWTVDEFAEWLSEEKDKKVVLSPWRAVGAGSAGSGACGLLWVTRDELIVKFNSRRSPRHQRQEIFHEFGHLLFDHRGEEWSVSASVMTEGVNPATIQRVMRRTSFDSAEERAAELLGTKLAVLSRERGSDSLANRMAYVVEPLRG